MNPFFVGDPPGEMDLAVVGGSFFPSTLATCATQTSACRIAGADQMFPRLAAAKSTENNKKTKHPEKK